MRFAVRKPRETGWPQRRWCDEGWGLDGELDPGSRLPPGLGESWKNDELERRPGWAVTL